MCTHGFVGMQERGKSQDCLRESIPRRFDLKTFRLTIAVCSLWFALTDVSAQAPPSDASLTANPVFQKNCAKCHGKTAEGRYFGGPSLIPEQEVNRLSLITILAGFEINDMAKKTRSRGGARSWLLCTEAGPKSETFPSCCEG